MSSWYSSEKKDCFQSLFSSQVEFMLTSSSKKEKKHQEHFYTSLRDLTYINLYVVYASGSTSHHSSVFSSVFCCRRYRHASAVPYSKLICTGFPNCSPRLFSGWFFYKHLSSMTACARWSVCFCVMTAVERIDTLCYMVVHNIYV